MYTFTEIEECDAWVTPFFHQMDYCIPPYLNFLPCGFHGQILIPGSMTAVLNQLCHDKFCSQFIVAVLKLMGANISIHIYVLFCVECFNKNE